MVVGWILLLTWYNNYNIIFYFKEKKKKVRSVVMFFYIECKGCFGTSDVKLINENNPEREYNFV